MINIIDTRPPYFPGALERDAVPLENGAPVPLIVMEPLNWLIEVVESEDFIVEAVALVLFDADVGNAEHDARRVA